MSTFHLRNAKRKNTNRNILNSLYVWFWIDCWSLHTHYCCGFVLLCFLLFAAWGCDLQRKKLGSRVLLPGLETYACPKPPPYSISFREDYILSLDPELSIQWSGSPHAKGTDCQVRRKTPSCKIEPTNHKTTVFFLPGQLILWITDTTQVTHWLPDVWDFTLWTLNVPSPRNFFTPQETGASHTKLWIH